MCALPNTPIAISPWHKRSGRRREFLGYCTYQLSTGSLISYQHSAEPVLAFFNSWLADNNNENMKDAAARIVPVILKMSKNLAPGEQAKVVVFLNEFNERLEADRQIDRGDFSDSKMSASASFGSDK